MLGAALLALCVAFLKLPLNTQHTKQWAIKVSVLVPQREPVNEKVEKAPLPNTPTAPEARTTNDKTVEPPASPVIETKPKTSPETVNGDTSLPTVDWYAAMEKVTSANPGSMGHLSPMAAAKEAAQERYAPVKEREKIWDKVEKDPYGRTLLKAGDCYRVLDDPHLPTIDIFENFTRFLVFCQAIERSEISLEGLDEIIKRYKHLQPPP